MNKLNKTFPENFLWGAAAAACQNEGGIETRGLTVSDLHLYKKELDRKNLEENEMTRKQFEQVLLLNDKDFYFPKRYGNDFYNRYEEDIALMKELGLNSYRFSISWSRIYPDETYENPSEDGLKFYDNVIHLIKKAKMEPIITLLHYDIPVWVIKKYGSFVKKEVVELFINYSKLMIERYANDVKYWIPFNQINLIHYAGFKSTGVLLDDGTNHEEEQYKAIHNQFVCNAKIKEFAAQLNKNIQIGVMLADCTFIPHTSHPKDVLLATKRNRRQYFYADVNLKGSYPKHMIRYFEDSNFQISIPSEDLLLISQNKLDFLAISYYYSRNVDHTQDSMNPRDVTENPYLTGNDWGWTINEDGFYCVLVQDHDRYNVPIMIAENGFGYQDEFKDGTVNDDYRIDYLKRHILAMGEAIKDGANIIAYLPWTSIDLVSSGTAEMSKRYGFVYVDKDDTGAGTNNRFKKKSFFWYKNVIESNGENLQNL